MGRMQRSILIIAAAGAIGASAVPAFANPIWLSLTHATEFTRECPSLKINEPLAMRMISALSEPPSDTNASLDNSIMSLIPPVPKEGTPPYNPDDYPQGHGIERLKCENGLKLFGPNGTLVANLLVERDPQ